MFFFVLSSECDDVRTCMNEASEYCSDEVRQVYSSVVNKLDVIHDMYCGEVGACQPQTALRCVLTLSSLTWSHFHSQEAVCR